MNCASRWVGLVALLGLLAACATPSPRIFPSVDAFTLRVAEQIRHRGADIPVAVRGPLALDVGSLQAYLDRIYRYCAATDAAPCQDEIDRYIHALIDHARGAPEAPIRADVRLAVRTQAYLMAAQASRPDDPPGLQARPVVDGLVALPVIDRPRTIRMLSPRDNVALGLEVDAIFDLGLRNLEAEWIPLRELATPAPPGRLGHFTGGAYESSRILDLAQWRPLAEAQGGALFVSFPTTNTVLYAGEASVDAIDALQTLARQLARQAPDPLTDAVLKWTPGGWQRVR